MRACSPPRCGGCNPLEDEKAKLKSIVADLSLE